MRRDHSLQTAPAPGPGNEDTTGGTGRAPVPPALRRRLVLASAAAVALTAVAAVAIVEAAHYAHDASASSASSALPAIDSPGFATVRPRAVPAFSLPELADQSVSVSSASLFDKPTLVNFWSSTCTICQQESPAMARAYRILHQAVRFVGVDTADVSRAAGLAFARRYGLHYQLLSDASANVAGEFGTSGLPTTYFVSGAGKILAVNLGALTVRSLEQDVQKVFHLRLPAASSSRSAAAGAA